MPLPAGLRVMLDGDEWLMSAALDALDPFPARAPVVAAEAVRDGGLVIRSAPATAAGRFRELQLLASDGHVTGHDGERLWMLDGTAGCSVPPLGHTDDVAMTIEAGFPVARAFRSVVRPWLQLAAVERGGVAIHASCVEVDGRAVLVAGWSESGKTETALALMEGGASFVSDKWTLGTPGLRAAAFPIGVGVRGWVLRFLPTLRGQLPFAARAQLRVAAAGKFLASPFGRWRGGGRLRRLATEAAMRSVALADRAALRPSDVRHVYGDRADPARELPIALIAVLRTRPGTSIEVADGDVDRLSRRLAVSAFTERSEFMALQQRAAYAEARTFDVAGQIEGDRRALHRLLDATPVVEVSAPFPTDPRRVADALMAGL
ncbi:MAG TPA: hypothetical protein VF365_09345 [Candidatus Limnocylindria bacterium]